MIPNPCCCGTATCEIAATDIVTDYTQISGTWSQSGPYIITNDANASIVSNTAHPDGLSTGTVQMRLTLPEDGITRMLLAYQDANNYLYFEFETAIDGFGMVDGIFRIGHRTAGADTILEESALWDCRFSFVARLCYSGSRISAQFNNAHSGLGNTMPGSFDSPLTGNWGDQIGIMVTGGTSTLYFNEVDFFGTNDVTCSNCSGGCSSCNNSAAGDVIPLTPGELSVYIEDVTNEQCVSCVALFDGATFILENPYEPPPAVENYATRSCRFELPASTGGCFGAGVNDFMRFGYGGLTGSLTPLIYANMEINNDGGFEFSRTSGRCDEVLTKVGGYNTWGPGHALQQCRWDLATAIVTPNTAV